MVQLINRRNAGGEIAAALGTGIQGLAQNKVNELNQRKQATGIRSLLPNITDEQASAFASSNPEVQKQFLKTELARPGNEAFARALFGEQGGNGAAGSSGGNVAQSRGGVPEGLTGQQALDISKQRTAQATEQRGKSKEANDYLKPYIEQKKKNDANLRTYNLLQKQVSTGKVRTGNWAQALSTLGLENVGRNYNTEISQKLIAQLAQNIAGVFGSNARVTNFLEQTFQRSLPGLWNTAEGIWAISELNKLPLDAQNIEQEIREQILRENNFNIVPGIELEVARRAKPQLDALQDEVIKRIESRPQFKSTGASNSFNSLEEKDPSQFKGKKIRDDQTGQFLISDGTEWVPEEEYNARQKEQ